MILTTPRLRMTLQCSQMGLTLLLTFMGPTPGPFLAELLSVRIQY